MGETQTSALTVRGATKRYGDLLALAGVDLEVSRGEVFAFLGPNGAGKTTLVEILEGYRDRDDGEIRVLGVDPAHPTRSWRERIGIVLQTSEIQPELTAREAVRLYAGYYPTPLPTDEVLRRVGLLAHGDRRVGKLSGGQKRRLDLALGIVGRPDVLFLDEPTTGFDPAARREAWELVRSFRDLGTTIFLTTHYMEEAEVLADRVAIIVAGAIVAEGTIDELSAGVGDTALITWRHAGRDPEPPPLSARVERDGVKRRLESRDAVGDMERLIAWARDRGVGLEHIEIARPTLEDVYLRLTREAS